MLKSKFFSFINIKEEGAMLDVYILADEVSHLLNTKYANTKKEDIPFNLAFTEIADKYHVKGDARGILKSEIGSILAKRPRKSRSKKKEFVAKVPTFFCVSISDTRSVEFFSKHRIMFRFGKDKNGVPALFSYSGARQPSETLKKEAGEFATYFFANALAQAQVLGARGIILKESSTTHVRLLIDNTFSALFVPTDKSATAHITQGGVIVRQKDVPPELMKKARAIALTHFKGAGSLPLDFG